MVLESRKKSNDAELVAPIGCQIGENPLWHPEREALFFLDILAGVVYLYAPSTKDCRVFSQGRVRVEGAAVQTLGGIVLTHLERVPQAQCDGSGSYCSDRVGDFGSINEFF